MDLNGTFESLKSVEDLLRFPILSPLKVGIGQVVKSVWVVQRDRFAYRVLQGSGGGSPWPRYAKTMPLRSITG